MEKILEILHKINIPFAYDHFAEGESPEPPFICYLFSNNDNFAADGYAYFKINAVRLELYTDEKSPDLEKTIETALDENGIFYSRSETWIDSEKLYEVLYQFEIGGM